jgi:hypothetical protein
LDVQLAEINGRLAISDMSEAFSLVIEGVIAATADRLENHARYTVYIILY